MREEDMEMTEVPEEESPYSHLLLVVHGIGAKKYQELVTTNASS